MIKLKYIVISNEGMEGILFFPEHINHSTFRNCGNLISAGFVNIRYSISEQGIIRAETYCHGNSFTLGLKSRPEEDTLLADIALRNRI